jgi:hypothetical protein
LRLGLALRLWDRFVFAFFFEAFRSPSTALWPAGSTGASFG